MGFWVGIKHALNSTVGTKDFLPLDKFLKQTLLDSKRLVPSDVLYHDLNFESTLSASGSHSTVNKDLFIMNMSGTFDLKVYHYSHSDPGTVTINVNGNAVASFESTSEGASSMRFEKLVQNITANTGDVVSVTVRARSSSGYNSTYVENVVVYAEVVDGTGITEL